MSKTDPAFLSAALVGYQQQLAEIDAQIAAIQKKLGGRTAAGLASSDGRAGGGGFPGPFPKRGRRRLSAEARKRIAEAQKKRWAAFRKTRAKAIAA